MSDIWGKRIKISIFGNSHGKAIGGVIDGLPHGFSIDFDAIQKDMDRRRPGAGKLSSPRCESDAAEILSGIYNGKTSGDSLAFIIRNEDAKSGDYEGISFLRPGHADWTALMRYDGFSDMRGGGHFSGRLTAPLVFAGGIAKQLLAPRGIEITGKSLVDEKDILAAKEKGDSIGGIIELCAAGIPAGWGNPFFDSVESLAASLFFSIPGVKGVEFGDGFGFSGMLGSEVKDEFTLEDGKITMTSNHNGGILGGITSGMPITARLCIKPTPSISLPQKSVNPATMEDGIFQIKGRHDPCIVPRAVPVAEACLALAVINSIPQGEAV